jgi:chitinase
MKTIHFAFLSCLALIISLSLGQGIAVSAEKAPIVLGYYPYWATAPSPQQIRFERYTHLIHAFVAVDERGLPEARSTVPDKALTQAARTADVKVLLGLGGGSNGKNFTAMVRDQAKSQRFIREIVAMAGAYGYDGLDIDWEFPAAGDEDVLVRFVTDLHRELKAANPQALLGIALPKGNYYGQWFRANEIKDKLDIVQIMTYDFHGPWTPHAGYNASLYGTNTDSIDGRSLTFDSAVDYWLNRGFSREQILVGIPLYGHGFKAKGWGQPNTEKSAYPDVTFLQVRRMLDQGWLRHWDSEAAVPWMISPDGTEIISYDDEASVLLKGAWAQRKGVGGIFFWNIAQDFSDGENLLVKEARAGWQMAIRDETAKLDNMRQSGVRGK